MRLPTATNAGRCSHCATTWCSWRSAWTPITKPAAHSRHRCGISALRYGTEYSPYIEVQQRQASSDRQPRSLARRLPRARHDMCSGARTRRDRSGLNLGNIGRTDKVTTSNFVHDKISDTGNEFVSTGQRTRPVHDPRHVTQVSYPAWLVPVLRPFLTHEYSVGCAASAQSVGRLRARLATSLLGS